MQPRRDPAALGIDPGGAGRDLEDAPTAADLPVPKQQRSVLDLGSRHGIDRAAGDRDGLGSAGRSPRRQQARAAADVSTSAAA